MEEKNMADWHLYDKIISETEVLFLDKWKDRTKRYFTFTNFNPKNLSHMYIYHCALIAVDIYNIEPRLEMKWWSWIKFKCHYRKHLSVKKAKTKINEINCNDLVDGLEKEYGKNILADIYNEYWSKK